MGFFDDAVPGGNVAKPLMIALGALLVGRMMGGLGGSSTPDSSAPQAPQGSAQGGGPFGGLFPQAGTQQGGAQPGAAPAGGLLGGLGGLLGQLTNAGHGDTVNSWVGTGANAPIQPEQLGPALGQTTISDLARHSGMSEQELLAQLSRVLPGVIDKLTPNGQIPSQAEIQSLLSR